jgi:hypothetical protein
MSLNFTLQDILGIFLAFSLFPFIFVFPGYITGWTLNLFEFRNRTLIGQTVMAMALSASIAPAVLFLVYRFTSSSVVIGLIIVLAIASAYILVRARKKVHHNNEFLKPAVIFVVLWIFLAVFTLIDLQLGQHLYFSSNSYDLTTRVSVVDAISRTGIPPINPSYYPGKPIPLNSLYYYWYLLASIVDQMGGSFVSAYHAMIASVCWAGMLLFATLATYLRVRDDQSSPHAWKKSFIAIQLVAVGGLDFIMVFMIMASFNFQLEKLPFQGHVEGWNMPIMSWINALAWVPHHLTAALACMVALLLAVQNMQKKFMERIPQAVFIGLAFASAFGLSVWVMFVFAVFWILWGVVLVIKEKKYQQVGFMILGGLFGAIFASPFLLGILQDGGASSSGGGLPVALFIRPFMLTDLLTGFPPLAIHVLNLLFLPLNYLFELGFFFMMTVLWFQEFYKRNKELSPIYTAELILVIVSTILLSFVHSTIIVINDLGIRGWLPMQFILVIWSSDLIIQVAGKRKWLSPKMFETIGGGGKLGLTLGVMLIIGYLTMGLEFFSLRAWPFLVDMRVVGSPNGFSPDARLGERTYSARLAYDYLRDQVPADAITQNNPLGFLDRPSGLYGTHQMAISDRTIYGVPLEVYNEFSSDIGSIFVNKAVNWESIDEKCEKYSIDILIINDIDPLWNDLQSLKKDRLPLYENSYYAIYSCGN